MAAAYVASTCHARSGGSTGADSSGSGSGGGGGGGGRAKHSAHREAIVGQLEGKYRIDSLGKCHRTARTSHNAGQVQLGSGATDAESLLLKQRALGKYMFYLAFENSVEPGYVTEKVFDALKAGTVPVYLGDSAGCKQLLPHPKAAIFLDDYISIAGSGGSGGGGGGSGGDGRRYKPHRAAHSSGGAAEDSVYEEGILALVAHLEHLSRNETAYNEHLSWRDSLILHDDQKEGLLTSRLKLHPMLQSPWPCRVCVWAREHYAKNTRLDVARERRKKEERGRDACTKM